MNKNHLFRLTVKQRSNPSQFKYDDDSSSRNVLPSQILHSRLFSGGEATE